MRRPYLEHYVSPLSMPEIHTVAMDRPWFWLSEGWRDFVAAPGISLAYGVMAALAFMVVSVLFASLGSWHWAIALMLGILFVGPVMAAGLYEISRRREGNLKSTLRDSMRGWQRNSFTTLSLGIIMVILLMAWFLTAYEMTALFVASSGVMARVFGGEIDLPTFLTSITWPMAAAASITGIFWLAVVFLLTVVSVPLAADHEDVDVITAIAVSVKAVRRNRLPMLLWAGLILIFAGVGVLPFFLGLIVTFPLLGYATWHAYRDLVG
ncbi:MAG TPA: DUF2189 domain-containing protein [Gammaproteobacteria bacterium]